MTKATPVRAMLVAGLRSIFLLVKTNEGDPSMSYALK